MRVAKISQKTKEQVLERKDKGDTNEKIAQDLKLKLSTVANVLTESRQADLGVDKADSMEGPPATGENSHEGPAATNPEVSWEAATQQPAIVSSGSGTATEDAAAAADTDVGNIDEPAQNTTPAVTPEGSLPDGSPTIEPPPTEALPLTWLLATNHQNMAYMLSTGLLTGPAGFGDKYYRDPSGVFPGWLPVFRCAVPEAAIESALSEGRSLQPCIAEVDIGVLRGAVPWISREGTPAGEVVLPGVIGAEIAALLLPAPLPAYAVRKLWFGSEEARRAFDRVVATDPTISLHGLSLEVRAGEILGMAGLIGAGRTEISEALAGFRKSTGQVKLAGEAIEKLSPSDRRKRGLVYVSEDRKGRGLHLTLAISENASLPTLADANRFRVNDTQVDSIANGWVEKLGIKTSNIHAPVKSLSGGNQQKVAIAKWLQCNPKVVIFDEPTRGVDVGAKREIYNLIVDLAKQGLAVILVSSELPEVIGLCHRVLVLRNGTCEAELAGEQLNEKTIMTSAAGLEKQA
jgi:ABC-type multidrug transport system ATPase subunit